MYECPRQQGPRSDVSGEARGFFHNKSTDKSGGRRLSVSQMFVASIYLVSITFPFPTRLANWRGRRSEAESGFLCGARSQSTTKKDVQGFGDAKVTQFRENKIYRRPRPPSSWPAILGRCSRISRDWEVPSPSNHAPHYWDCILLGTLPVHGKGSVESRLATTERPVPQESPYVWLACDHHCKSCALLIFPAQGPHEDISSWRQIGLEFVATSNECVWGAPLASVGGHGGRGIAGDKIWLDVEIWLDTGNCWSCHTMARRWSIPALLFLVTRLGEPR